MLSRLIFDTTDAQTKADSANVGAYLRSSDGTLLTHTDNSGKLSLDVHVANAIAVDVSHTSDSIRLGDGSSLVSTTTVGPDVGLDVNIINASVVVSATDFDIRNLAAAQDSVSAHLKDGSGNSISSTANAINSFQTNDPSLANTAILASQKDVSTSASALLATQLSNRKYLHILNDSGAKVYVGQSGVTLANGFPIGPGSLLTLRCGPAISVHALVSGGVRDTRLLEIA